MSGERRKPESEPTEGSGEGEGFDLPIGNDELDDELEAWDQMFDALHEDTNTFAGGEASPEAAAEAEGPGETTPPGPPGETVTESPPAPGDFVETGDPLGNLLADDSADLEGSPEALGELLTTSEGAQGRAGAKPPGSGVSASERDARESARAEAESGGSDLGSSEGAEPAAASGEGEDILTSAPRPPRGGSAPATAPPDAERGQQAPVGSSPGDLFGDLDSPLPAAEDFEEMFEELTRSWTPDADLLQSSGEAPQLEDDPALDAPPGSDDEDADGDVDTGSLDADQLGELVRSAEEQALPASGQPAGETESDGDYADIEIGERTSQGEESAPSASTGRRLSTNIVRRGRTSPPREEEGAVFEVEAEPSGVFELEAEPPEFAEEEKTPASSEPLSLEAVPPGTASQVPSADAEAPEAGAGAMSLEAEPPEPGAGAMPTGSEPLRGGDSPSPAEPGAFGGERPWGAEEPGFEEDFGSDTEAWVEAPAEIPSAEPPLPAENDAFGRAETGAVPDAGPPASWPEPRLPRELPELALGELDLPDSAPPLAEDRSEAMARELLVYESELDRVEDAGSSARLCLEAGRLTEALGDLDRAGELYRGALEADPELSAAMRGLRRIARASGEWSEAIAHLDAELAFSGQEERAGLLAHRLDLLDAAGDRDAASETAAARSAEAPEDVRARIAGLELAFAEGRADDMASHLDALAAALEGDPLAPALARARAAIAEATGAAEAAASAYEHALLAQPGAAAWLGRFGAALAEGAPGQAADALAGAAELVDPERYPELSVALCRERAELCAAAGDEGARLEAHWGAASGAPDDTQLLEDLARACEQMGEVGTGVQALGRMAALATTAEEQAWAYRRAARLEAEPAAALGWLWSALRASPSDPLALADLERALAQGEEGEGEGLEALEPHAVEAGDVYLTLRAGRRRLVRGDAAGAAELVAALRPHRDHPALATLEGEAMLLAGDAAGLSEAAAAAGDEALVAEPAEFLHRRAARVAELAEEGESGTALAEWSSAAADGSSSARAGACRAAWLAGDAQALSTSLDDALAGARHPARIADLALRRAAAALAEGEGESSKAASILADAAGAAPDDPRLEVARLALLGPGEQWLDIGELLRDRAELSNGIESCALRYRAASYLAEGDDPQGAAALLEGLLAEVPSFTGGRELLDSVRRRAGEDAALEVGEGAAAGGSAAGIEDRFSRLVREAEALEVSGDAAAAFARYRSALEARPGHPLAREGLSRVAAQAGEVAVIADLALADLRRAESEEAPEAKADAYEELARIDGELRGDAESAVLGWEGALHARPERPAVLRALERAYAEREQLDALAVIYGRLRALVGEDAPEALVLTLERARIASLLGRPRAELRAEYSEVYRLAPGERTALFALEADRREQGPSAELAELDAAVATYFEGDPRAQAAFLTRSAEILEALGESERAIARFRESAAAMPGYPPALAGWQRAALRSERWRDAAGAAEAEAENARSDGERARLYHLAGVLLMDREEDDEGAAAALRRALAVEPTHADAFARLWRIFERGGQYVDLSSLLFTRLEVESDPGERIALNRALASLHERAFADPDETAERYRAILEIDAGDTGALSGLADLAEAREAWQEAVDALVARARVESDPATLVDVFLRMGVIYADRLGQNEWAVKAFQKVLSLEPDHPGALERLAEFAEAQGDWALALSACERLLKLDRPGAQAVADLHRVARICEKGFGDRDRAERAYRAALEQDPASDEALDALVAFYRQGGDPRALRIQLDRVAAAMRSRLGRGAGDASAYRVIARALAARGELGVAGSAATAANAADIAEALGEGGESTAAISRARPSFDLSELGGVELDDILFPRSVPGGLRHITRLLFSRIAKQVGADVRRHGVGRGDRRKRGDPVADVVLAVAAELGVRDVDIYVTKQHSRAVAVEPTTPPALILGSEIADPERVGELRFAAGRALKIGLSGLAALAGQTPEAAGLLVGAIVRQFQEEFAPQGIPLDRLAEEQQRLRKLVPGSLTNEIAPYAVGIAGEGFDPRLALAGIVEGGNRAGLLACGSAATALRALARLGGHAGIEAAASDPATASLMRFSVSEDFAALAAALGART